MIYKILLPKPSEELINLTSKLALAEPIDESALAWHKSIQDPSINCAAGSFFMNTEVTELARVEYQKFFTKDIFPIIGVMTNTIANSSACYPPHSDRMRTVGINYYIDLGGKDVCTVLYNKHDDIDDQIGGHVEKYGSLIPTSIINFKKNIWYALDTRQYHSVENIVSKRYLLSLSFINTDFNCLSELMPSVQIEKNN